MAQAIDHALQTIARVMRANTRESDLVARVGGDEFCILFSGETGAAIEEVIERIRSGLAARDQSAFAFELAVSVGALEFDPARPARSRTCSLRPTGRCTPRSSRALGRPS
jgi:diguanylate cyclase (GGDEF)-like protein